MGKMLCRALGLLILTILLWIGQIQNAVLTIEPNCSTYYLGESVSFRCDMNEGEDNDWEYQINRKSQDHFPYNSHKSYTLEPLYKTEFQCCGRRRIFNKTKCSNTVFVTVSVNKPRATLTAGSTTIPVGGSVTLSCSVETSAGWKYRWFRRTSDTSEVSIDNEENRDISVTQGGIYRCDGVRGNPGFYTEISNDETIEMK
ncbi:hypothetical protein CHARACLAT_031878, partial [Characodon lateralis]|nr:hypothetical protein [Characodon lateralis]